MPNPKVTPSRWFVYILGCADGTLYTGITTDLDRRVREHNGEGRRGARYTRGRRPVSLVYAEPAGDRGGAARREAAIRKLSRREKLAMAGKRDRGSRAGIRREPASGER